MHGRWCPGASGERTRRGLDRADIGAPAIGGPDAARSAGRIVGQALEARLRGGVDGDARPGMLAALLAMAAARAVEQGMKLKNKFGHIVCLLFFW